MPLFCSCDFETYAHCGLEQERSSDSLDWQLLQAHMLSENGPSTDNTFPDTDYGKICRLYSEFEIYMDFEKMEG